MELQQQEIASLRLLGCEFLLQLQEQLQDYRRHFEPEVLFLAISVWRGLVQRLLLLPRMHQELCWRQGSLNKEKIRQGWGAVCDEWESHMLDTLQRILTVEAEPEKEEFSRRPEQRQTSVRKESSLQKSSWAWHLPEVLRGPSPLHDMLRYFILRSFLTSASRFLGPAVAELLRTGGEKNPERIERESSSLDEKVESSGTLTRLETDAEAEQDEVLCSLAKGVSSLRAHVQSELLLYSGGFASLLPLRGEHPLLVLTAAEAVLDCVVHLVIRCADKVAQDPEKQGLPARGGRALLAALTDFERLVEEVRD